MTNPEVSPTFAASSTPNCLLWWFYYIRQPFAFNKVFAYNKVLVILCCDFKAFLGDITPGANANLFDIWIPGYWIVISGKATFLTL